MAQSQYTRTFETGAGESYPRFYMESIKDMLASEANGRPIFNDVEMVQILMPANRLLSPTHKVTDVDRQRWPEAYRAFRDGEEMATNGTPLEHWPALSRAQVHEFKGMHIRTVEDVAKMADSAAQQIPFGMRFRDAAAAYLDTAAETALTLKLSAENDRMAGDLAGLQRQNEELKAQMNQMWAELQAMRSAPNPLLSQVIADPYEQARNGRPVEAGHSSFENFTAPKRRGRPPSAGRVEAETEAA